MMNASMTTSRGMNQAHHHNRMMVDKEESSSSVAFACEAAIALNNLAVTMLSSRSCYGQGFEMLRDAIVVMNSTTTTSTTDLPADLQHGRASRSHELPRESVRKQVDIYDKLLMSHQRTAAAVAQPHDPRTDKTAPRVQAVSNTMSLNSAEFRSCTNPFGGSDGPVFHAIRIYDETALSDLCSRDSSSTSQNSSRLLAAILLYNAGIACLCLALPGDKPLTGECLSQRQNNFRVAQTLLSLSQNLSSPRTLCYYSMDPFLLPRIVMVQALSVKTTIQTAISSWTALLANAAALELPAIQESFETLAYLQRVASELTYLDRFESAYSSAAA